jgi:hypothetical protein
MFITKYLSCLGEGHESVIRFHGATGYPFPFESKELGGVPASSNLLQEEGQSPSLVNKIIGQFTSDDLACKVGDSMK